MGYSIPAVKRLVIKKDKSIRKKVYDHLREAILNGHFAPNERLVEARIAGEIGTSRTPIREALHSLERENLVRSIPNVGYIVNPLSKEDVKQICEIRKVIEELAVKWAMQKANKRLIRELSKNIEASEMLDIDMNAKGFTDLDAQFHEIIARLSGSERLLELAQTLRRHMLRYRMQSIFSKEVVIRAINGHRGILKAIESGDAAQVKEAIDIHLEQSKIDTLRFGFEEAQKEI